MIFLIKIKGSGSGYAYSPPQLDVGIILVDKAREELGLFDLDLGLISPNVLSSNIDPTIEISEYVARESGLFEDCNRVTIEVEKGFLNQFGVFELYAPRNSADGRILSVQWKLMLDKDEVVAQWANSGYPTKWK